MVDERLRRGSPLTDREIADRLRRMTQAQRCAHLELNRARAEAALADPDADLHAAADELAQAAMFAVEADPRQRPDRYSLCDLGFGDPAVVQLLARIFERHPERKVGILERLHRFHER